MWVILHKHGPILTEEVSRNTFSLCTLKVKSDNQWSVNYSRQMDQQILDQAIPV